MRGREIEGEGEVPVLEYRERGNGHRRGISLGMGWGSGFASLMRTTLVCTGRVRKLNKSWCYHMPWHS